MSAALAKVTVTLPRGLSSVQLFSPNYPGSFPDDDVMEWSFQLPEQHSAHVQLLKATSPQCQKKNVALEYHSSARVATVLGITDPQPQQNQGNFSLMLRNCEIDKRRSGSQGLTLSFQVSSSSQSSKGLCSLILLKVNLCNILSLSVACAPKPKCSMPNVHPKYETHCQVAGLFTPGFLRNMAVQDGSYLGT